MRLPEVCGMRLPEVCGIRLPEVCGIRLPEVCGIRFVPVSKESVCRVAKNAFAVRRRIRYSNPDSEQKGKGCEYECGDANMMISRATAGFRCIISGRLTLGIAISGFTTSIWPVRMFSVSQLAFS
jgi:hypothetical protein